MREEEEIKSLPNERVIFTRHAKPKAASHAPKVNRTMARNSSDLATELDLKIANNIKFRIMASRARRVINRWLR